MTDGNTGFHVAPITEDDMNRVTSILKRAMDTMIGASQLAADVDMLRQTVSGLQADAERLRNQNNALDEALNHSRQVRDEQSRKIEELEQQRHMLETVNHDRMNQIDKLTLANEQLVIDLDLTRKAKDDAEFKALELEEKLAIAEGKLAKVAELHKALFPPVELPKPERDDPVYDGASLSSILGPVSHPEPVSPVTDTRPESVDEWEPGYIYDHQTNKYWRRDVAPKLDGEAIPF